MAENNTVVDSTPNEEVVEALREEYKTLFWKDVSNAKKNDVEWIKSKIDEAKEDSTPNEEVVENNTSWKKVKIKLVTDVFYEWKKVKEWTILELVEEEVEKFADTFYEKC